MRIIGRGIYEFSDLHAALANENADRLRLRAVALND